MKFGYKSQNQAQKDSWKISGVLGEETYGSNTDAGLVLLWL